MDDKQESSQSRERKNTHLEVRLHFEISIEEHLRNLIQANGNVSDLIRPHITLTRCPYHHQPATALEKSLEKLASTTEETLIIFSSIEIKFGGHLKWQFVLYPIHTHRLLNLHSAVCGTTEKNGLKNCEEFLPGSWHATCPVSQWSKMYKLWKPSGAEFFLCSVELPIHAKAVEMSLVEVEVKHGTLKTRDWETRSLFRFRALQALPDLPDFQLSSAPDDYVLPEIDPACDSKKWEIQNKSLKEHLKDSEEVIETE